ncbi:MAG: TolC family protein [Pseudomonas sp.]|uniref:efflux transporter outer membrane subunit n=1 Tax=Pseudomonas abieticivorans TaxID=2931382 RepID=UPI0020BDE58B|nr:TolC family protein [Pseudomonas sp. PIA16]MDE1166642.1 TolC family protein [Pseudomonas sp.]
MRTPCVLLSVLTLSACSNWVAHVPAPSALGRQQAFTTLPQGVEAQPLPQDWWHLYRDPVLDGLVRQALAHNRDLAAAQAHVQAMLAGLRQADAERWPSTELALGASYGKTADDQTLAKATGNDAPSQWEFNPGVELAYQVDLWGQVQKTIERAQAQAEQAQAAQDLMRINVVGQTTRAYVSACALGARSQVQRQSLDAVEHSVRLIERQRQGGVATDLEVSRMQALQGQTQAVLPMLDARRQSALYELAMLTGSAADVALNCTQVPQLAAPLPVGEGWALLARRPDIRQAQRQLQADALGVDIAQADLYPKVTFGATLTSSSHALHELGDSSSVMFGVGPLISWQFPNQQANRARVAQAKAIEQGSLARFDGQVLKALMEVRQSLALYNGERQRHQALQRATTSSEQAYDLAQRNYQAGALDFLDVLDSEREWIGLQAQLADADGQLVQRQVALFRALGGGWQSAAAPTVSEFSQGSQP